MDEDDTTKYGEFICSFDAWLPLDVQKEQARKMQKMTKKDSKKD